MQARWKKNFGIAERRMKERDGKGISCAGISPSNQNDFENDRPARENTQRENVELGYLPSTEASSFSDETPLNPRPGNVSKPGASNHALEPWYIIVWHDWRWECLTSLLVILIFAWIVTGLIAFDGTAFERYRFGISVNVIVAILSVVMKSAMIVVVSEGLGQSKWNWFLSNRPLSDLQTFDSSTRGPVGAVKLLWVLRGRNIFLSIGAIITILTLIMDPFVQQVIQIVFREIEIPTNLTDQAGISRTNFYENKNLATGNRFPVFPRRLDEALNIAMWAPRYNEIYYNCSTGTCTFNSIYHTVEFCSSCNDITSDIHKTCQVPEGSSAAEYYCDYLLLVKSDNSTLTVSNGTGRETAQRLLLSAGSSSELTFLLDYEFIQNALEGDCAKDPSPCSGAISCSISPCVNSHQAVVSNGLLQETRFDSVITFSENSLNSTYLMIDMGCIGGVEKRKLASLGYELYGKTHWMGYMGDGYNASGDPTTILADIPWECTYGIDTVSSSGIQDLVFDYFGGSVVSRQHPHDGITSEITSDVEGSAQLISLYTQLIESGHSAYSLSVFESKFGDMADGINRFLRMDSGLYANGTLLETRALIHVRWPWLCFPGTLVVLTILFILRTIVVAVLIRQENAGHSWKSSVYPILFGGVEPGVLRLKDKDQMKQVAKGMHVKLEWTVDGWKFVKN